jgi:hypothetical protein
MTNLKSDLICLTAGLVIIAFFLAGCTVIPKEMVERGGDVSLTVVGLFSPSPYGPMIMGYIGYERKENKPPAEPTKEPTKEPMKMDFSCIPGEGVVYCADPKTWEEYYKSLEHQRPGGMILDGQPLTDKTLILKH